MGFSPFDGYLAAIGLLYCGCNEQQRFEQREKLRCSFSAKDSVPPPGNVNRHLVAGGLATPRCCIPSACPLILAGNDFTHDRQRDLLGALGADLQPDWGMDALDLFNRQTRFQ